MLLTSSGHRGDGKLFADLGFAAYLLKPVTQRDLIEALIIVLGENAETWRRTQQPIVTHDALVIARSRRRERILLAEDNPINQKVAVRMLERLGFRVEVVANGREAVEACASHDYGRVLMDCQMPVLDGYAATREIRKAEGTSRHTPIVALTAHAMKGADEECLAAGMDAYLTKPIDSSLLERTLESFLGPVSEDTEREIGDRALQAGGSSRSRPC